MIRDFAEDTPLWLALAVLLIGFIGFIVAASADSGGFGVLSVLFLLFGGFVLVAKLVLADDTSELIEVTGRLSAKYLERRGERLPSGYIGYTDSLEPTGSRIVVSNTHYQVSGRLYDSADVGAVVVLTIRARDREAEHPRVTHLAHATPAVAQRVADLEAQEAAKAEEVRQSEELSSQQEEYEQAKQSADDLSAVLGNWGIDALALDLAQGFQEGDPGGWGWIEIPQGPIRWAAHGFLEDVSTNDSWSFFCLIPDSRIKSRAPRVSVLHRRQRHPIGEWHVKDDDPLLKTYWRLHPPDEMLSSNIAKQLNQNPATRLYDFEIGTNLTHGCWMVMADVEFTRSLWDAWEAIAEVLLAMPMPPETSSAAS